MTYFLSKVLKEVLQSKPDLAELVFVLPNRRAGVYLKKQLREHLKTPAFLPEIITFDHFAEHVSGIPKTSTVELLFDFYNLYKQETPEDKTDSFEVFSKWASVVLNDINEIDAYLTDPKAIFGTLKAINQLNNWNPNTELTRNYLTFFRNLERYYHGFYKYLIDRGKGYQGLILKEALSKLQTYVLRTRKRWLFAGFNHLKNSELQIVQELLSAGKAEIYWDTSVERLRNNHSAGYFLRQYKSSWHYYKKKDMKAFSAKALNAEKIEIVGVAKEVGMLKYAAELIKNSSTPNQIALVLGNQNILPVVLNSIPKTVDAINITMGVPLRNFPFSDLIRHIFELHIHSNEGKQKTYYHRNVFRILQHPIVQTHSEGVVPLIKKLIAQNKAFITYRDIEKYGKNPTDKITRAFFSLFENTEDDAVEKLLLNIDTLIDVLKDSVHGYEKEILYKHYQLNRQLLLLTGKYNHITHIKSLYQLYKQLLYSENVNFLGEPLRGFQIMGFLETQALDFQHLIITSVNEGTLPKGNRGNSFIPFDVRKHYGLPTFSEEDAIVSYHFFRLLFRAKKVSLLYNAETDTFGGGEKSRFLTQLLWEYPKITHKIANPKLTTERLTTRSVLKTPEVIEELKKLANKGFSPSALATYLYNPLAFYQQKILKMEDLNEIEETLANNKMGEVIHNTLEELYKPFLEKILTEKGLQKLLPKVSDEVKKQFEKDPSYGQFKQGKNRLIYEVVVNYVKRFIEVEINAVRKRQNIRILALEKKLSRELSFPEFDFSIRFTGIIDRIDEVNGNLRIVDYKSSRVEVGDLRLDDFQKVSDYKYSKGLQVLLYAYLYTQIVSFDFSKELQAGIISFRNLKNGFIPVNFAPKNKYDYRVTSERLSGFLFGLRELVLEIFDPTIPFVDS